MAGRAAVPRLGVMGSPHIEGYHGVAQGGPSNWGRRNPTRDHAVPAGLRTRLHLGPRAGADASPPRRPKRRAICSRAQSTRGPASSCARRTPTSRATRAGDAPKRSTARTRSFVGALATAFTRGLQGDDPRYWKTAALLKHFLANSNEDDRGSSSSNFDERLWREYYAKPFEDAVRVGGSRALMAAYNAVNGTPAHVHPMLRDIVMREWGLDGILCTDGGGLRLLVSDHKAFPDLPTRRGRLRQGGHQPLPRPAQGAGDRGDPARAAHRRRRRRRAARPLPRVAPPRSPRSARARPVRRHRRRGRSRALERCPRRAPSSARSRESPSCCSRTRRTSCLSTAPR